MAHEHASKKHDAPQSKAAAEQELQKKYVELQMLKQHLTTIVQQKQMIDERGGELQMSIEALKALHTVKQGEEIWSTIGSGTFIKSAITDHDNVLVAVGAGVVLSEKVPKALTILESRVNDLNTVTTEIVQQAEAYIERINKLEPEVEKLAEQLQ